MNNTLLYAVTVLIWGTTFLGIEYQLGIVPPEVSIVYRYVLASGLLFAWAFARRLPMSFGIRPHLRFMLLGLTLFSLNYVLTYHSQQHISSALAAIVFSSMLWMNLLNARVLFGVRAGRRVIAGSLLGIAGTLQLFLPEVRDLTLADQTVLGIALAGLGAYVASLGNMVSQSAQASGLPIVQSNAWGMLYGAAVAVVAAWLGGRTFTIDWSAPYLLSLSYLAVFGSVVAFGTYLTLLGRIGAHRAGYAMVMFPVVAILISLAVGEIAISWSLVSGVALVLGGNVLVLRGRAAALAATQSSAPPCQEMNFQSAPSRTSTSV